MSLFGVISGHSKLILSSTLALQVHMESSDTIEWEELPLGNGMY